jgi:hypothetical protein
VAFPAFYQTAIGSGSTSTSSAWFVGGFRLLTVSIQSGATQAGAANCIIQGSNADGLQQADLGGPTSALGWSNITIVLPGSLNAGGNVGRGLFTFDPPGYRWVRSFVSSTEHSVSSAWTVIFTGVRID